MQTKVQVQAAIYIAEHAWAARCICPHTIRCVLNYHMCPHTHHTAIEVGGGGCGGAKGAQEPGATRVSAVCYIYVSLYYWYCTAICKQAAAAVEVQKALKSLDTERKRVAELEKHLAGAYVHARPHAAVYTCMSACCSMLRGSV